jgi:curved DNA-binding protein CbpA
MVAGFLGSSAEDAPALVHALRVLGLPWPCRIEDVKSAFRSRAKQTHPDLGGRTEDFRAASDAYQQVLEALVG